jgi:hypothetical protein
MSYLTPAVLGLVFLMGIVSVVSHAVIFKLHHKMDTQVHK